MRATAAALGYLPTACRACRPNNRSLSLKAKMRPVTSPMSERGTIVTLSRLKCSAQRSVRELKNRTPPRAQHDGPDITALGSIAKGQA
jgi:hypothetical protein